MGTTNDIPITAALIETDSKIIAMLEYMEVNDWELNLGVIPSSDAEYTAGKYKGLEGDEYIQSTGEFAVGGAFEGQGLYELYTTINDNYPTIPLWMDVEYCTNYAVWDPNGWHVLNIPYTLPAGAWECWFGDNVDWILANYPNFQGFTTEYLTGHGLEWLYGKTSAAGKKMMLWWPRVTPGDATDTTLAWHKDYCDIMCAEPFDCEDISYYHLYFYQRLIDEGWRAAGKQIGFHTNYSGYMNCAGPDPLSTTTWWDIQSLHNGCTPGLIPVMPKATQQERLKQAANQCKAIVGSFDVIEAMFGYQDVAGEDTPEEQLRFYDSLNLLNTDVTQYPQTIDTTGYSPSFAPVCGGTSIITDTFENTEKEIILVRALAAATHTIVVSGTDSFGEAKSVTYSIPLTVAHSKLLGTYPIRKFGYNPTITYDSKNIRTSIIRVT